MVKEKANLKKTNNTFLSEYKTYSPLESSEFEVEIVIEEDEVPLKPFYQYLNLGEDMNEGEMPSHLVQFDTETELNAYMQGLRDALGYSSIWLYEAKINKEKDTIRFLPERME